MLWAIWYALRFSVPLNTACSRKWAIPGFSGGSNRVPDHTHTPIVTDRTWGMRTVTTRMPFGRTVFL